MKHWAWSPWRLIATVIWDGECTRVVTFERPSGDVMSIEKMVSQKSVSDIQVSMHPVQAKG